MGIRVELNDAGVELILKGTAMRDNALRPAAEAIAEETRRVAPRDATLAPGRRKHYVETIAATAGLDGNGDPVGRVNAFHFTSLWIEFGSVNNPAHAPLRLGLDGMTGRAV